MTYEYKKFTRRIVGVFPKAGGNSSCSAFHSLEINSSFRYIATPFPSYYTEKQKEIQYKFSFFASGFTQSAVLLFDADPLQYLRGG